MNEDELAAGLAPTASYRYAHAVGDRLYLAGQVPHDGAGNLVGVGDVTAQANQCLDNLFAVVGLHGFVVADIRQLTVYVVGGADDLSTAWRSVAARFGNDVPPATLLGVNLLGYGQQQVEIDAQVERHP